MLASDGLTDNVHLEEIVELIRKGPLGAAASSLVDKANRRMQGASSGMPSKPDDLSLVLFRKPYRPRS